MKGLIAIGIVLSSLACADDASERQARLGIEPPEIVREGPGDEVIVVRNADFSEGQAPASSADAALPQIVNLTAPYAVTNGGTLILHAELSAAVAAPTFVVQLAGEAGYHTLVGADPEGDRSYDISVRVAADAVLDPLRSSLALLDAAGNAGPAREVEVRLLQSGTGDVKVTLSFDRLHDLDLRVIEPTGDQIFYQRPMSTLGGQRPRLRCALRSDRRQCREHLLAAWGSTRRAIFGQRAKLSAVLAGGDRVHGDDPIRHGTRDVRGIV